MIAQLEPNANSLINNLNDRVVTLKVTLDRVNDLLNDENRKNISGTVAELHGMLAETGPRHSPQEHAQQRKRHEREAQSADRQPQ